MAKIAPAVFVQELDNNGDPLAGGELIRMRPERPRLKSRIRTAKRARLTPTRLSLIARAVLIFG